MQLSFEAYNKTANMLKKMGASRDCLFLLYTCTWPIEYAKNPLVGVVKNNVPRSFLKKCQYIKRQNYLFCIVSSFSLLECGISCLRVNIRKQEPGKKNATTPPSNLIRQSLSWRKSWKVMRVLLYKYQYTSQLSCRGHQWPISQHYLNVQNFKSYSNCCHLIRTCTW